MAGFSRFGAVAKRLEQKFIKGNPVTERSAFSTADAVEFRIRVPESTVRVTMEIFSDATGKRKRYPMTQEKGRYSLTLDMSKLGGDRKTGLFYYKYRVQTEMGVFDMKKKERDFTETYEAADEACGDFQLLVYEKRKHPPTWLYGGVFYQIFPDRFFSAGNLPPKEDAVLCRDIKAFPEHLREKAVNNKNNVFFGGDLAGITAKLDYLESLGVTCLYLNPIFESSSNHRYNTADYSRVDSMLGTREDLQTLIDEAKKRGIGIILDGVFNHTGSDSIYFNKDANYPCIGAAQSEKSQYSSWYTFTKYPTKYESWWGIETLPRVKSDDPTYRHFLFGRNGIVRRYTRMGIAGWRLDVADELSDAFLAELSSTVRQEKADAVVVGEVWEDATNKISYGLRKQYFNGRELDSVMNYPVQKAVIAYLSKGDFAFLRSTLESIYSHYPPEAANALMNLLGSHDTERILTMLGDQEVEKLPYEKRAGYRMSAASRKRALARLRLAVCIQMSVPGIPMIYYGDEAGMEGHKDPFCRLPFPWGSEDRALTEFYRKVVKARRSETVFREGSFSFVYADADVLCYERRDGGEKVVVVLNRGSDEYEIKTAEVGKDVITGAQGKTFSLKGQSFIWIHLPDASDYNAFVKIPKSRDRK
ncbi:MAG: glycoside hydrolase family 13 protein [Clostridia bacterium]|nr:glycoside hydrolase family 13 protein [Clostridia bacterium]